MTVERINLPIGRIVWGNPAKPQIKKNYTTKQPVIKNGEEVEEWTCGIAIPKDQFNAQVWPYMQQEAITAYPNGQPRDFSWKFVDGDSMDKKNQPYSNREGYGGCMVINISTEAFAPSIFKFENGAYHQIGEGEIKCGDYVIANIDIKGHTNNDGGLYINPNGFELVGLGNYIASNTAANPEEMFKKQEHQLPQGATPLGQAPQGMPAPAPQGMPAPAPQGMPAPAPQGMPAPAHDFVNNVTGGQPAPLPQQGMPAQPAAYPQTNNAQPVTGTAPSATTYPTNGMPAGMPAPR